MDDLILPQFPDRNPKEEPEHLRSKDLNLRSKVKKTSTVSEKQVQLFDFFRGSSNPLTTSSILEFLNNFKDGPYFEEYLPRITSD